MAFKNLQAFCGALRDGKPWSVLKFRHEGRKAQRNTKEEKNLWLCVSFFGFQPVSPKADFVFNLVAGACSAAGESWPATFAWKRFRVWLCFSAIAPNAWRFYKAPGWLSKTFKRFAGALRDGKPSSVSQGLCGMENLEVFWNFATKAERHKGTRKKKKAQVSDFVFRV